LQGSFNSSFGWPGITALDLPSGGATPGARIKVEPNKNVTLLVGIFNAPWQR
jgi:hypothetical protein